MQKWCERLDQMRTGDGRPVPARIKIKIEREWKRLKVVAEQVREVEAERDRLLTGSEPTGDLCAEKMRRLVKLHGIGPKFACATLIATRTLRRQSRRQSGESTTAANGQAGTTYGNFSCR